MNESILIVVSFCSKGLDPLISNEVGLNVSATLADLKPFAPKTVVQNAANDHLHKLCYAEKVKANKAGEYKLALPNDMAKSVAPFNRHDKYK